MNKDEEFDSQRKASHDMFKRFSASQRPIDWHTWKKAFDLGVAYSESLSEAKEQQEAKEEKEDENYLDKLSDHFNSGHRLND